MKNALLLWLLCSTATIISSCGAMGDHDHTRQMEVMKDSIFKAYPSVAAVTIKVQGAQSILKDNQLILIVLGSKKLAQNNDEERQKIANDLGAMTIRLFGKNSGIQNEKLIITANEQNDALDPKDGVVSTVNVDSL